MKILHIISSFNVGGAERFVVDLAKQQQQLGQTPTVLAMKSDDSCLQQELEHQNIDNITGKGGIFLIAQLKRFDVIHIHSRFCLPRVLIAALFVKTQIIYTHHNEQVIQDFKWRAIYAFAAFRINKFIFVSSNARDKFLGVYRAVRKKSRVILNGVKDIESNTTNQHELLQISHVGRFVALKSQHVLLQAVAKLPTEIQQKLQLNFFGDGPLLERNKQLAKGSIGNVKCIFHGLVSSREHIYQHTDILVVTSETEGLSLAIIEAMAARCAIIASDVGGNGELVTNNENGFLYPYADEQKLANHIESLVTRTQLRKSFGEHSRAIFENKFTMNTCAQKYAKSYQQSTYQTNEQVS